MRRRSVLTSACTLVLAGCTGSESGSGTTTKGATSGSKSSLEVTDTGCGSEKDGGASVSFEERTVAVAGTIVGNNGCYRARLGGVTYDESSDTCRVVVKAFDDSGQSAGCVQCITTISYDVTVVFDGRLPGTVEIVHDDLSGEHTVETEKS